MWAALKYRFQLSYCVMVAALAGYAVSSSGALAWLVPSILNNDRLRVNYVLLAIAAAAALAFAAVSSSRACSPAGCVPPAMP